MKTLLALAASACLAASPAFAQDKERKSPAKGPSISSKSKGEEKGKAEDKGKSKRNTWDLKDKKGA